LFTSTPAHSCTPQQRAAVSEFGVISKSDWVAPLARSQPEYATKWPNNAIVERKWIATNRQGNCLLCWQRLCSAEKL
jgi:hypothetical protein